MAILIVVVNKRALHVFSYPAAIESFHYLCFWGETTLVRRAGAFETEQVHPKYRWAFWFLLVSWTSCIALFNTSLRANSEPAAFHSKLMSVKMYKHLRGVSVFVSILTYSKSKLCSSGRAVGQKCF